jgi:nitroreductase
MLNYEYRQIKNNYKEGHYRMRDQYELMFKRKSFRKFNSDLKLSNEELQDIEKKIVTLERLDKNIRIAYKIVPREQTTCKRGEYCILIYSENSQHSLLNIGYIFEQLDLYLASKNIGVCWYGMGKVEEEKIVDLIFVIMLAIGKSEPDAFRKDYTKSKRKAINEIWSGDEWNEIANYVRYAPSACNSQPWRMVYEQGILSVYKESKTKMIIPKDKIAFYNTIDMGIFLCFIEIWLIHNGYKFSRVLVAETGKMQEKVENANIAKYTIISV